MLWRTTKQENVRSAGTDLNRMFRDGLTNMTQEQAMWVLEDEHSWEISMCKCPEVGAYLRSSKEAVGNRENKT